MADTVYPPGFQQLLDKLTQVMLRHTTPRPASPYPTMDMAIHELAKKYPQETGAADIKMMPWDNGYANTNIMGTTDVEAGPTQTIQLNPSIGLLGTQKAIEGTLRHELEHVKQHINAPPSYFDPDQELDRKAVPYDIRPEEISAARAAEEWMKRRRATDIDRETLFDISPSQVFPKSPWVK